MSNEVPSRDLESELVIDVLHRALVDVETYGISGQLNSNWRTSTHTLVARGIRFIEGSNPLNKALHPPLLKQSHQRRSQCFTSI